MGGASEGSFNPAVDLGINRGIESLDLGTIQELSFSAPYQILKAIELAREAQNPELAGFMIGLIAGRALERPVEGKKPLIGQPKLVYPSDNDTYTRVNYRSALFTVTRSEDELSH